MYTGNSYKGGTPRSLQVAALAQKAAKRAGRTEVGPEHLLLGILLIGQGVATNVLQHLKVYEKFEIDPIAKDTTKKIPKEDLPLSESLQTVLAQANKEQKAMEHHYLGTEHFLLALIKVETPVAENLRKVGLHYDLLLQCIHLELDPNYKLPTHQTIFTEEAQVDEYQSTPGWGGVNFSTMREYGWLQDHWFPISRRTPDGVYVKFPKHETPVFFYNAEVSNVRPTLTTQQPTKEYICRACQKRTTAPIIGPDNVPTCEDAFCGGTCDLTTRAVETNTK